jgi:DNA helicase-2/ATP-dependent DNA helicase PcrA
MNWSYSKGCTLDSVCVILTKDFENIDDSSFVTEMISPSTVNKLYVAMTRSRGDLYLIKHSTLKKLGY